MPPPKRRGNARKSAKPSDSTPYTVASRPSHAHSRLRSGKENGDEAGEQPTKTSSVDLPPTEGAVPYADLGGVLDRGLLEGLDAMGFK